MYLALVVNSVGAEEVAQGLSLFPVCDQQRELVVLVFLQIPPLKLLIYDCAEREFVREEGGALFQLLGLEFGEDVEMLDAHLGSQSLADVGESDQVEVDQKGDQVLLNTRLVVENQGLVFLVADES